MSQIQKNLKCFDSVLLDEFSPYIDLGFYLCLKTYVKIKKFQSRTM